MARKPKVESKKPDPFVTAYQNCIAWVRGNTRTSIIIGVVIVCIGLAVWALSAYQANKNQEAQYALSQGIKNFDEYAVTGKGDGLSKAEEDFKGLTRKGPAGIRDVARLYLARIAIMKGKPDEARALYGEVLKHPSNDVVKKLSENGLGDLQKKP